MGTTLLWEYVVEVFLAGLRILTYFFVVLHGLPLFIEYDVIQLL